MLVWFTNSLWSLKYYLIKPKTCFLIGWSDNGFSIISNMEVVMSREQLCTFSWNKRFTPHSFFRYTNTEPFNQSGPSGVLDLPNSIWGFFASWTNVLHIRSRQWRADNNASLDWASLAGFAQISEAETSIELTRIWMRFWSFVSTSDVANTPALWKWMRQ